MAAKKTNLRKIIQIFKKKLNLYFKNLIKQILEINILRVIWLEKAKQILFIRKTIYRVDNWPDASSQFILYF